MTGAGPAEARTLVQGPQGLFSLSLLEYLKYLKIFVLIEISIIYLLSTILLCQYQCFLDLSQLIKSKNID